MSFRRAKRGILLCARADREFETIKGLCGGENQSEIPRYARNDNVVRSE